MGCGLHPSHPLRGGRLPVHSMVPGVSPASGWPPSVGPHTSHQVQGGESRKGAMGAESLDSSFVP